MPVRWLHRWFALGPLALLALLTLAELAALASPPRLLAQPAHDVTLRVIASAGIAGRFGEPVCRDGVSVEPHEDARFTSALTRASSGGDAFALDTGGLLAPHGVARYAARDQPEALATLVEELGYRALALGEGDLSAPRARTLQVARALQARGIPYVLSNLRCAPPSEALCEAIVDASDAPLTRRVGAEDVALIAMIEPAALGRVAPDRAEGLRLSPITEALPAAVRRARRAGATIVVAVVDLTSSSALTLAHELPEDARPDLVLLADEGPELLFARPPSVSPALSAPPLGGVGEVRMWRSDALEGGVEMLALPLEGDAIAPAVERFTRTIGEGYCAEFGARLAGGHLDRELDVADVAGLAARILREFAGADVAILNEGAVHSAFRPSDPAQLSHSDLYIALEYDEPIVVADVPASWLLDAMRRAEGRGLLTPGLTHEADDLDDASTSDLRIRGRAPVPSTRYRVATVRFLARGGDDALPALPEGSRWRTLEHTREDGEVRYESLRDVALAALSRPSDRDPRDVRDDPNAPPEWVIRGALNGTFSGSSVSNPSGYDASLLTTAPAIAMGLEASLVIDATAPLYSFENRIGGSYRTQWSPSDEEGARGQFVEANDQIQLRSMFAWRGLRSAPREVWIPDLYVEAFVETELSRPDKRAWHWLLVRPTLGARFALAPELDLKVQLGTQAQLLDPTAEATPGAGAILLLRPWAIFEADERSLTLQGDADFFVTDVFDEPRFQLRGRLELALALGGPVGITFGGSLYAQQDPGGSLGLAVSAEAGLRLGAVTRAVGP